MNDRELENRIRTSYENIAPDIRESILSDCEAQKGQVIVMQERKRIRPFVRYMSAVAAALLLFVGGMTGMNVYQGNHAIDSTIMLDVNPSIEIQVNKKEKVLDVKPLNDDAKVVVGDMDFSGSNLDVTVNALIGSMLRNGYISDAANSILVTVDNNDPVIGQAMQTKLMNEINAILESGNVSGAVLGQTVTKDKDAESEKLARQYGITVGKAKLTSQITEQNSLYSFEELVPLTINELNLISESGGTKLENVESIGTASASAYIGDQAAKDAAFKHAGVKETDVIRVRCGMDWENGMMVYEVDFDAAVFEYEYEINAKTGDVVSFDKEADDDFRAAPSVQPGTTGTSVAPAQTYIGDAAAKAAALKHAGVNESDVYAISCEPDHEHGLVIYDVDFKANGFEYDYDINALTGEVVKYGREVDDDYVAPKPPVQPPQTGQKQDNPPAQNTSTGGEIDAAKAKSIALGHAGVSDIRDYECEVDYENGRKVFEISFDAGVYEYDYEIDASTGNILKSEKESD